MNPVISREYVEKNYIHKDVLRQEIKRITEESKNLIRKGSFDVGYDEFTATNIEGLNDLINYQSKGIMVKILNEILEDK